MIQLDGIAGLLSLEAGSVGLVLSDLPSGETRAEFDRMADLDALWPAVWHAVGPRGVAVLMASSLRFAARVLASQEKNFRHDVIWEKSHATGHLNASRAPLRSHEFVLVFARKAFTYRPQMIEGPGPIHAANRKPGKNSENYGADLRGNRSRAGATDRFPTSVIKCSSVGTTSPTRVHPQQKPVELLRRLIATYSEPGALVVDPYAGSGSTGHAAHAEGRRFVGWDTSPRFARPSAARAPDSAPGSQASSPSAD